MNKTNRNRLFAVLLAIIPIASYYYFLTDFISNNPETDNNSGSNEHRQRIEQNHSVPTQLDQSDQ